MNTISYLVNFKTDISVQSEHFKKIISRMENSQDENPTFLHIERHAAAACSHSEFAPLSKICEGYQFSVVFDGKLQNTHALKRELRAMGYTFLTDSDAELALNCYIHCGERCPEMLDGNYCFVIYDAMRRQVFAAVDFFSSHPLFCGIYKDEILIASKISGILPFLSAKISAYALRELLSFECSGNTFDGIFKIPPSHYLKIKGNTLTMHEYTVNPDTRSAVEIISENLDGADCENLLYTPCSAANMLLGMMKKKNSPSVYPPFFADITPEELRDGLKKSVNAYSLPIFSHYDFLLPYFSVDKKSIISSFPYDIPRQNELQRRKIRTLLNKPVSDTMNFSDSISFSANKFTALPPLCPQCEIHFPLLSHGLHERLSVLPCNPDLFFESFGMSAPEVYRQNYTKIRFLLRRELLSAVSDKNSPINAFFSPSSMLMLCEGKFDFPADLEIGILSYLLKLNIWFCKYRPSII